MQPSRGSKYRNKEARQNARTRLEKWRRQTFAETYTPSPFTSQILLPNSTLTSLASNASITTVDDLTRLRPPWAFASIHGQEVLDLLQQVDQYDQQQRLEKQTKDRAEKKRRTEARRAEKKREAQRQREEQRAQKLAQQQEAAARHAAEREARQREHTTRIQLQEIQSRHAKMQKEAAKELRRVQQGDAYTTHLLASSSAWNARIAQEISSLASPIASLASPIPPLPRTATEPTPPFPTPHYQPYAISSPTPSRLSQPTFIPPTPTYYQTHTPTPYHPPIPPSTYYQLDTPTIQSLRHFSMPYPTPNTPTPKETSRVADNHISPSLMHETFFAYEPPHFF
ncbi:hypothetical protein LshimejAT787_1104260 [Lyophyllum shimeji]|uniref:Uncharacterized protein n=1 Tax=Lyophyllum shimeji TaxID=47721 RepID=A0A9P3PVG6_LYOSH|nr:hypothetical protein LshimejAT787_1003610 [Lyophyllum shimeji]GLB42411.1 hypothetical protein LshimejAT787_1104260 [Lyophyllum shimeji]